MAKEPKLVSKTKFNSIQKTGLCPSPGEDYALVSVDITKIAIPYTSMGSAGLPIATALMDYMEDGYEVDNPYGSSVTLGSLFTIGIWQLLTESGQLTKDQVTSFLTTLLLSFDNACQGLENPLLERGQITWGWGTAKYLLYGWIKSPELAAEQHKMLTTKASPKKKKAVKKTAKKAPCKPHKLAKRRKKAAAKKAPAKRRKKVAAKKKPVPRKKKVVAKSIKTLKKAARKKKATAPKLSINADWI